VAPLGNELAQKGIRTLILETGPRIEREQHVDDERQSFAQLTGLDKRTTSGSRRIAKDSPNFPANVCKVVDGTTVGCSLRAQQHEFGAKDVYGHIAGASLLNWPLTLAELEPYYDKAEDKMGVTGTHGIPLLDADNNQIVMTAGAKRLVTKSIPQTTWPSIRARATGVQRRLISQHTQLVQSRRSGL
jgi:choline dehydrogenase-like flavoprotein